MKATGKLLNIAYKSLIKPRSQWDTLSSAFATVVSILSSQSDRDKFVDTVNKGVINPTILGQADMGFFMTLALHHDLNNDLFKRNGFSIEEFMQGAEPALENFQEVLYSLDRQILPDFVKKLDTITETMDDETKIDVGDVTDVKNGALGTLETLQSMEKIVKEQCDWKNEAKERPDSLYGQLYAMVSEQLLEACRLQFLSSVMNCYFNQIPRIAYTLDSGEIQSIALLSARAHEVIPENNEEEEDEEVKKMQQDPDVMVDVSLTPGIEKKYPIAAQIEVLYSIAQKFQKQSLVPVQIDHAKDDAPLQDKDGAKDSTGTGTDDDKEFTLQTTWVAIFEGILNDGTDNAHSLRWKLIDNRPAYEFPEID